MNPYHFDTPRRSKARGMGEIISCAERLKDDKLLGKRVREIVERVRQEEAAWRASLNADGLPLKAL